MTKSLIIHSEAFKSLIRGHVELQLGRQEYCRFRKLSKDESRWIDDEVDPEMSFEQLLDETVAQASLSANETLAAHGQDLCVVIGSV